jgi:tRNA pseudouridine38-40 synthase
MKTYRLTLGYDGTDFHGWQRQPDRRTVQGVLEESLLKITRKKIAVHGAGRTDAGVHARGQVASFRASLKFEEEELRRALNAVLDDDARIQELGQAEADFHARKSAKSKIYVYRIIHAQLINPFDFRYALHWPYPLRLQAMRTAAAGFVRKADFSAFSSNRELNPVRSVLRSALRKTGDEIVFTVEANGFLRYMVRTLVGTLLEIGQGKYPPGRIEEIFRKKDRSLAGPTAPAKGLCLVKVLY